MKCDKAQSLMLDSLYGGLSARKQKAFEEHLGACAECAREFASQKATVSAFQQLELEKPPPAVTEIVRDMALKELEQGALLSRKKSFAYWKPALASAAAAVLVLVTFYYYVPQVRMGKQSVELQSSAKPVAGGEADKLSADNEIVQKAKSAPDVQSEIISSEKGQVAEATKMQEMKESRSLSAARLADQAAEPEDFDGRQAVQPYPSTETPPAAITEGSSSLSESGTLRFEKKDEEAGMKRMPLKTAPLAAPASARPAEETAVAQGLYAKGNHYFEVGEYEKAAGLYQQVISLKPGTEAITIDAHFRLGQAYQSLKRYEKALVEYKAVIDNYPDYASVGTVYIAAGDCYLALGKSAEAVKSYEIAMDRFPELQPLAAEKLSAAAALDGISGEKAPAGDK